MLQVEWITANAGSGKTSVLLQYLLKTKPENALCLTFSNAAADEVNSRINKQYSCSSQSEVDSDTWSRISSTITTHEPVATTLHSFCLSILQAYNPYYQVLDSHTKHLLEELSACCPEKLNHLKSKECWLDFDDILDQTLKLLQSNLIGPALEQHLHNKSLICIDEAQDLSPLQWQVIFAIAQEISTQAKIVIASDPKQSIYGFQGACLESYKKAFRTFAQISEVQFKHTQLDITYRLPLTICDLVDRLYISKHKGIGHRGQVSLLDCNAQNWMQKILDKIIQNNPKTVKILIKKRSLIYNKLAEFLGQNNIQTSYGQNATLYNYVKYLHTKNKRYLEDINIYNLPTEFTDPFDLARKLLEATKQKDDLLLEKAYDCHTLPQLLELLARPTSSAVQIQTIYSAKGQEADMVFLCDTTINPKMLPSYNLEEHKRTLYVGLTRAKQQLYIVPVPFTQKLSEYSWLHQVTGALLDPVHS